jgi:hypothetical protein
MDPLQHLLEIHALHQLKARYFRYWDGKDFESWLSLFCDDATLEVEMALAAEPDAAPPFKITGKQAFRDTVIAQNLDTRTIHRGHTPDIILHSAEEASGIWAMDDIIERRHVTIYGHGYYHESYLKKNGSWYFKSVRLTRVRYTTISR